MRLTDILSLFTEGKATARSHIKNLIEMALVDGNFDLIEYNLLQRIAHKHNISDELIKEIKQTPASIKFFFT